MDYLIGLIMVCVVGVAIWAGVDEYKSEKFYLRKDQWTCTKDHVETQMIAVADGRGGTNMVPNVHSVCDKYERR